MSEVFAVHAGCGGGVLQAWTQEVFTVDLWPRPTQMVRERPFLYCTGCRSVVGADELEARRAPVYTVESIALMQRVMRENSWLDYDSSDYGSPPEDWE